MIDGGLSRTPRPADRQPAPRPDLSKRQTEAVVSPVQPEATSRPRPRKGRAGMIVGLILGFVLLAAGIIGGYCLLSRPQLSTQIDSAKYQAVFLSSGQVYFGKLTAVDSQYLKLSGVFYIQSQQDAASDEDQITTQESTGMQLIKLGEEVHGPEDTMVINRDQMLFFENLKSDGKVTQLIRQHSQGGN